jgi:hypothetical protein
MRSTRFAVVAGLVLVSGSFAGCEVTMSTPAPIAAVRQRLIKLPPPVDAWTSSALGLVDPIFYDSEMLVNTGRVIHRVKALRRDNQQPTGACFDGAGSRLADCGRSLRAAEEAEAFAKHGALDAELHDALRAMPPDALITVALWLRTTEPVEAKEKLLANPALLAAHEAERRRVVEAAKAVWKKSLPESTAARVRFDPSAPVAYAELRASEILTLAKGMDVAQIYRVVPPRPSGTTAYPSSVNSTSTGYSGSGEKVCAIEVAGASTPNNLVLAASNCQSTNLSPHARIVAGVIRDNLSPYGVATGSSVYLTSQASCTGGSLESSINWCVNQSATIWNYSVWCQTSTDRLFDYYVKNTPWPLVNYAGGNHNDEPMPKQNCGTACTNTDCNVVCKAFNGLIVGAVNDCNTSSRTDDVMACFSCHLNSDNRELPMIVAPGQEIQADGVTDSGTSYASPMVAAAAAQVVQRNTALRSWPEALRSILMAGATENISASTLDLHDSIDDRDGAGELDVATAVTIADSANKVDGGNAARSSGFDYGTLTSSGTPTGNYYSETYVASKNAWHRLRVVLNWDSTASCTTSGGSTTCSSDQLDADLDLYVYRKSDGQFIAIRVGGQQL